jgi:hypothetical protein
MPKGSAGWSVLAEKALEIGALALAIRVMDRRVPQQRDDAPQTPPAEYAPGEYAPAEYATHADASDFIEPGESVRVYRARDHEGEMIAAFYPDGRIRLADDRFRFAGVVQNSHAHLLDVRSEDWSELFVRTAPNGALQLELRDGPYDARILTCEPLE